MQALRRTHLVSEWASMFVMWVTKKCSKYDSAAIVVSIEYRKLIEEAVCN